MQSKMKEGDFPQEKIIHALANQVIIGKFITECEEGGYGPFSMETVIVALKRGVDWCKEMIAGSLSTTYSNKPIPAIFDMAETTLKKVSAIVSSKAAQR